MATLGFLVQKVGVGKQVVLWILVLVWATDTGAYAFGRLIGGPRLAPLISPNKTWAGFIGGTLSAGVVGTILAHYIYPMLPSLGGIFICSLLLSTVAHAGDLMESAFKRYFGVKDSGSLIPGHGGLLDRLDSLLAVTLVVGAILYLEPIFMKLILDS
jgi:phosphatidate cytidylyltransferase